MEINREEELKKFATDNLATFEGLAQQEYEKIKALFNEMPKEGDDHSFIQPLEDAFNEWAKVDQLKRQLINGVVALKRSGKFGFKKNNKSVSFDDVVESDTEPEALNDDDFDDDKLKKSGIDKLKTICKKIKKIRKPLFTRMMKIIK